MHGAELHSIATICNSNSILAIKQLTHLHLDIDAILDMISFHAGRCLGEYLLYTALHTFLDCFRLGVNK